MTSEQLDRWASEIRRRDHGTTHWDGCEESHPRCRELALITRVRELEAERDRLAAKLAEVERERDEAVSRSERVSSFAATLIGNACERHSAEIAVMGFHEFQQVQPKSCHWCCEAERDRLAAEVERLREALERIADMAMTATVKGAPPLSGYRVRQIVGAALAALADVPAPAREESPDA